MIESRMSQTTLLSRLAAAFVVGIGILLTSTAQAQVVAVVYGEPITARDVEHRARLEQLSGKPLGRKEVLDMLVDDKLKIREAKRFTVTVSDNEVEEAFSSMAGRMRMKPAQLADQMAKSGTSATTIKNRLRAEMAWQRIVRGRFSSTLTVSEQDILNALGSKNTGDAQVYEYTLHPILFVVPEGSGESAFEGRKREAEALRGRFQGCEAGLRLARALRDVAVRAKVIRGSADLPPPIRTALEGMELGRLTPPEVTRHGVELFALCEKVPTRADSPQKKEAREKVFAERFDEQAKRYLAEIRRTALIEYK